MPYDPEKQAHIFNGPDRACLTRAKEKSHVYLIPPGRTLRRYMEELLLFVDEALLDHPIMDKPTVSMEVSFIAAPKKFFALTHGNDLLEQQIKAMRRESDNKRSRWGLIEVEGILAGAPEAATALLMHREATGFRVPGSTYPHKWMLVDIFAGIPHAPGVARLGGWDTSEPLHLATYRAQKPKDLPAAAVWTIPRGAAEAPGHLAFKASPDG